MANFLGSKGCFYHLHFLVCLKFKGEGYPTICHEGSGKVGVVVYLYSFCNLGARCGKASNARPRPIYATEIETMPIVYGTGSNSGRGRKISPPPEFEFRDVQPVANRYTH
jgi:hypothetical protein